LVIAGVNFLFVGPILVGIPVLANLHLASGAVGFGLLMSGFSGGHLAGFLAAAVLPRLSGRQFRWLVVGSLAAFGGCLVSFAWIRAVWILFAMMMTLGLANGYLTIILFTWIQTWTPMAMLGRTMSLLLLASAGLLPVSQALSGAMGRWSLPLLFAGAGGLILAGTIWAATQPGLRQLSEKLTTEG
jgi:hypothetical protein